MKTQTQLKFFQLCANYLQSLLSQCSQSLSALPQATSIKAKRLKDASRDVLHALRGRIAGLKNEVHAQVLAYGINSRILTGVAFISVLAPASMAAYLLFDKSVKSDWYYENAYWFMWTLAPHLNNLFTVLGIFLLFPIGSKRSWFLIIPVGHVLAKIIHFATVQSNEQYHQVIGYQIYVLSFLTAIVLLISLNWLTHRKFHEFDSLIRKIPGLVSLLPESIEKRMLNKTANDLMNWNKKF